MIVVFWVAWACFAIWATAYFIGHLRSCLRSQNANKQDAAMQQTTKGDGNG